MNTKTNTNWLLSPLKSILGVILLIPFFSVVMGFTPLPEGISPGLALPLMVIPPLGLFLSDSVDTFFGLYAKFKQGVDVLEKMNFSNPVINKFFDDTAALLTTVERLLALNGITPLDEKPLDASGFAKYMSSLPSWYHPYVTPEKIADEETMEIPIDGEQGWG